MPSPELILENLSYTANTAIWLAVAWHVAVGVALVALASRHWQPSRKRAASLLALPALSVSAVAWLFGNPFNGAAFLLIAALIAAIGARLPADPVEPGSKWSIVLGAAALGYAWLYPHFVAADAAWLAVGSPMGVLPCPTLALIGGFGLIAGAFGSRAWAVATGLAGLFFGLVGILSLGVLLDSGLVIVSGALLVLAIAPHVHRSDRPTLLSPSH